MNAPQSLEQQVANGLIAANQIILRLQTQVEVAERQIEVDKPKVQFYDLVKYSNIVCHFQGMANVLHNNGIDIGRNRLIRDFRNVGDIQQADALFTQKALNRNIGQNVQTGTFDHNGVTQMSFRAFLNYKGICEVFDRYGLTQDQRDAVIRDLTAGDELAEAG